jgi:hypothetical protein
MTVFVEQSYLNDGGQYYIRAYHGRYIGAHSDGVVVTDDEGTKHHDIQWMILNREHGKVALQIVKYQTFLSAAQDGTVRCSDRNIDHDSLWNMEELKNGKYGFRSSHDLWLSATGMTKENPPEKQPHLVASKEHSHDHGHFEIIPVKK